MKFAAVTLSVALLTVPGLVSASTETTMTSGSINGGGTVLLDQFDASLGTLTGVQLMVDATLSVSGNSTGTTEEAFGINDYNLEVFGDTGFELFGPGGATLSPTLRTGLSVYNNLYCSTQNEGEQCTTQNATDSDSYTGTIDLTGGPLGMSLSDFIGAGDMEMIVDPLSFSAPPIYGARVSDTLALSFTGNFKLTYTYETEVSAVPLPAGLPLMLVGLGAFGLMRRRKG